MDEKQQPETTITKRARGDGRIFLRGTTYWCSFYVRGKGEMRESCRTSELKQAEKYLRARLKAVHHSELDLTKAFLTVTDHKRTIADLMDALKTNFESRGKDSLQNLSTIARVRKDFCDIRATSLSADAIARYVRDRQAEEYRPATINRFVTVLRQGFKLADLPCPKVVKLSEIGNVRRGFFENGQIRRVMVNLSPDLADFVLYGWLTGTRKGEIAGLRWEDVEDDLIVLRSENAKNGHSRTIPITGELAELMARRKQARKGCDLIFHQKGKPIKEFRKSWKTACKMAGVSGKLFHDLRRSAVRDLVRSGVSQALAKSISGHRTDAMFSRYNISDTNDQRKALQAVQDYRLELTRVQQEQPPEPVASNAVN